MIDIALVGYGYWGKNLARNFNNLASCKLKYIVEPNEERAEMCRQHYPQIEVVSGLSKVLDDAKVEAVVIATPVDTHYELARKSLEAGKHVLVEKPLTNTVAQAQELVELAQDQRRILMVDHTYLYTGAVRFLKDYIVSGELGSIYYIDSTRINLGLFQNDVNVLWDLAPHDISMCFHFIGKEPVSVQATGIAHNPTGLENIAFMTLKFADHTIAHFNCSWISPVKIRLMLIGGDKKMIVFNDLEATEKVKIYDTGFQVTTAEEYNQIKADYRVGDIRVPKIANTEALLLMAKDFIDSIVENRSPVSSAELGLSVVKVLEAAQLSIKQNGIEIKI